MSGDLSCFESQGGPEKDAKRVMQATERGCKRRVSTGSNAHTSNHHRQESSFLIGWQVEVETDIISKIDLP